MAKRVEARPAGAPAIAGGLNRLGYHPAAFRDDRSCTACGVCFRACPEPAAEAGIEAIR